MKRKILIVDDDKKLATMVQDFLPAIEYQSRQANNADQGLAELDSFKPDLILLDINLPGVGGFEFCRILRENPAWKKVPVIMISGAARSTHDKVSGLKTGADDYLTKPFELPELLARIRALLRRTLDSGEMEPVLLAGEISLDLARRLVTLKNKTLKLTPKEFDLLTIFIRKKGHVLSRPFLLENIWGTDSQISTRTVDVHITSLRAKLGPVADCLQTESTVGYRFVEK